MRERFKPPTNLCYEIADFLSNQVIKGELKSGEKIKEARLAEELGVSRGPIREALQILERKRLVERKPRRGTRVVKMSSSYVDWLYDIIVELYGLVAKRAAEYRTEHDLVEMRKALKMIKGAATRGNLADYYDGLFQFALIGERAAKNPLLEQMLGDLEPLTRRVQFYSIKRHAEDLQRSVTFFEQALRHIEDNNSEMACKTIREYAQDERKLALRS
jgi:DNA-binding GntR family transcriptional regulator